MSTWALALRSTTESSASVRKTTPRNESGSDSKSFLAAERFVKPITSAPASMSLSIQSYHMVCDGG